MALASSLAAGLKILVLADHKLLFVEAITRVGQSVLAEVSHSVTVCYRV